MKEFCRILHLEDNQYDGKLVQHALSAEGLVRELVRVETRKDYCAALNQEPFDLILSDYTLPGFDGMAALALARERQPDTPFIFVSGTIEEEMAVESLKQGASDYVLKNRLNRLVPAVRRALQGVEERDENRRAEECMRQSEHKYRQVFENLTNAAFLSDLATGRIIDVNPEGELLLGRPRTEIIGLNQNRFLSPRSIAAYREAIASADERKTHVEVEVEVTRKDGTVVPTNLRAAMLVLYGRKLVLGLCRDVSARKKNEERLQLQGALLDLVAEAVLAVDLEDHIQLWNHSATELYGWRSEEAVGRKSTELLCHDSAEVKAARQKTMQQGGWSGELHQLTRDHHEIIVRSRWNLSRDAEGHPKSIMLVNTPTGEKPVNRLDLPGKIPGDFHDLAS